MLRLEVTIPRTKLHDDAKAEKVFKDNLKAAITEASTVAWEAIVVKAPRVTGRLATSIELKIIETSDGTNARIGTSLLYFLPVELGQKPHWAPVEPFILWAKRKFGATEEQAERIGYAVRASVRKKGTKGKHFTKNAILFSLERIEKILEGAGIKVVGGLLESQ